MLSKDEYKFCYKLKSESIGSRFSYKVSYFISISIYRYFISFLAICLTVFSTVFFS